jgi:hypothetical protein
MMNLYWPDGRKLEKPEELPLLKTATTREQFSIWRSLQDTMDGKKFVNILRLRSGITVVPYWGCRYLA